MTVIVDGLTFADEETGLEFWRQVRAWEARVRTKARRMPPCLDCGKAMWLGQERWNARVHRVCMERTPQ